MVRERHPRGRGIAIIVFSAAAVGLEESVATKLKRHMAVEKELLYGERWF